MLLAVDARRHRNDPRALRGKMLHPQLRHSATSSVTSFTPRAGLPPRPDPQWLAAPRQITPALPHRIHLHFEQNFTRDTAR